MEIIYKNKKVMIKARLYIAKNKNEIIRRMFLCFNDLEFDRFFYDKRTIKNYIEFLKSYNIPIEISHCNYNCSYADLPF